MKNIKKTCKLFHNWRNFAKSGHTAHEPRRRCQNSIKFAKMYNSILRTVTFITRELYFKFVKNWLALEFFTVFSYFLKQSTINWIGPTLDPPLSDVGYKKSIKGKKRITNEMIFCQINFLDCLLYRELCLGPFPWYIICHFCLSTVNRLCSCFQIVYVNIRSIQSSEQSSNPGPMS